MTLWPNEGEGRFRPTMEGVDAKIWLRAQELGVRVNGGLALQSDIPKFTKLFFSAKSPSMEDLRVF